MITNLLVTCSTVAFDDLFRFQAITNAYTGKDNMVLPCVSFQSILCIRI